MYEVRVKRGIKRVKIDVYVRNSIQGYFIVGNKAYPITQPNRLLRNFYALLWGILTDSNVGMADAGGGWYSMRVAGDVAYSVAYICTCAESSELDFDSYNCSRNSCHSAGAFTVTDNCAEYGCAVEKGGNSIMSFFRLFDTGGYCRGVAMAHKVVSVAGGQTVKHRICFGSPWLRNIAAVVASIACDCNKIVATDVNGDTYNLRGGGEVVAGPAEIVVETGGMLIKTRMYRFAEITANYAYLHFTGLIAPTENISADNIWLMGKFYDTGGGARETPVMKVSGGTTLEKGKLYSIAVHVIGG